MNGAPLPERRTALRVMLTAVSVALVAILVPFFGTLLWSVIVALLFTPLYRWLLRRWPGRRNRAALVTLLAVMLIVVLPVAALTLSLAGETATLYARLESGEIKPAEMLHTLYRSLPSWAAELLQRLDLGNVELLQRRLTEALSQGGQRLAARALRFGQDAFELVASVFVMLYLAFFLVRDGQGIVRSLREALPLSAAHQRDLIDKFSTVIRATVKGNLVVAALQGALGGLAFWVLDLGAVLLWSVLMAFVSLLPAVGAALVWLPVALYLLATGQMVQGLGLMAWGVLVVGLVDNLLRPVLVGKDTRLPDWVVLITTLGGMAVFGINGFVIGPVIAAMFIAVWHIAVVGGPAP